jgi:hypothetical protein
LTKPKANRSSEELDMRRLIEPELRRLYPDARIVHEPSLRYSECRLDMAAIRPTEIIGVEIKSSRDVMDRLEKQLRSFAPICSKIIVALAPKWNEKLPMTEKAGKGYTAFVPQYTETQQIIRGIGGHMLETWTVCADTGRVEVTDHCYSPNQMPWGRKMLDVLHVAELHQVMFKHRIAPGKNHEQCVRACHDLMTGREIVAAVCGALRARDAFAKGSDPPIIETQAA